MTLPTSSRDTFGTAAKAPPAAANIAAARAQFRIQRAGQLPQVGVGAGRTQFDNGTANQNRNQDVDIGNDPSASRSTAGVRYTADVSTTAFEVDLFGRLQSLSDAALNRYFGTEAAARATRLTLVGDIADAWLTYAADRSLLTLAQATHGGSLLRIELAEAAPLGAKRGWKAAYPVVHWSVLR